MTKPMSAADYSAHAEKIRARRPTEIVTLKTGSVFELRRPDIQAWVMTGRLPQSLLEAGLEAWKAQGKIPTDAIKRNPNVISDAAIFALMIVQECTVNPRLVEFPDPNKRDEIGPEKMLEEDFNEIYRWAVHHKEVPGLNGLHFLREGRERRTTTTSTGRKRQRNASKSATKSKALVS